MSDPTAGFTDTQWYMYRQRNVAYFAAYTSGPFSELDLLEAARSLVDLAPQLKSGFPSGFSDDLLKRAIRVEQVPDLSGFPDCWLDSGAAVMSDPSLPLFRLRYASLAKPDADGRAGFLLVQVSHALVEGADSAQLSRSHSAEHRRNPSPETTPTWIKVAAAALGAVLAGAHLFAGNLVSLTPGPFVAVSRSYPRAVFSHLARSYGVRQRSLLFALALATLFDAGIPGGKRRIVSIYSSINDGIGQDSFMRMRMRVAAFRNRGNLGEFVRATDAQLSKVEKNDSGFNDELNAAGIHVHRRLSRILPALYTPRLFNFMPYDAVLALVPPHRLAGKLTSRLLEPVYAGAALQGANACVMVPGRTQLSFNFYIQEKLLPKIRRLDEILAPALIPGSE